MKSASRTAQAPTRRILSIMAVVGILMGSIFFVPGDSSACFAPGGGCIYPWEDCEGFCADIGPDQCFSFCVSDYLYVFSAYRTEGMCGERDYCTCTLMCEE